MIIIKSTGRDIQATILIHLKLAEAIDFTQLKLLFLI